MLDAVFVQPIAGHSHISSYLIVRDADDRWFLWIGNDERGLLEIPTTLAIWLRKRPEIEDLPLPRLWFESSSLPISDFSVQASLL